MCCTAEKELSTEGRPNQPYSSDLSRREGRQGVQIPQAILVSSDVCLIPGQLFKCYWGWVFNFLAFKHGFCTQVIFSFLTLGHVCLGFDNCFGEFKSVADTLK